jgi:hypothetical protein
LAASATAGIESAKKMRRSRITGLFPNLSWF